MPYSFFEQAIYLLIFILPAYVANSAPVLLGGKFAIDMGAYAPDKQRWLGEGKTWTGLFGGFFAGMLASVLEAHLLPGTQFDIFGSQPQLYLAVGALTCAGALFGDLAGSFAKRRLGIASGAPSILDQLTFLFGALLFCLPLNLSIIFKPSSLVFLVCFTYAIHKGANYFAHIAGIKKVPW